MKNFFNQKIGIALGLSVICLFCSIYLSIGYQVIDNYLGDAVVYECLLVRK